MLQLVTIGAEHLSQAMVIINDAKAHLKALGVNQWQEGYPSEGQVAQDIAQGKARFIQADEGVLGYVCLDFDPEPDHNTLEGTWCSDGPYMVIHRLAINGQGRGRGLIGQVLSLVEGVAMDKDVWVARVDTPEINPMMMHLLPANGYTHRGTISLGGKPRLAFDKTLRR